MCVSCPVSEKTPQLVLASIVLVCSTMLGTYLGLAPFALIATVRPVPIAQRNAPAVMMAGPVAVDRAPTWPELQAQAIATPTGMRIAAERVEQAKGAGPAHTDAKMRLFGQPESAVRVTLYRDMAAWCASCPAAAARWAPHL